MDARLGVFLSRKRCQAGFFIGLDSRVNYRPERPVHHLIKVVGLVPGAVIGDAVFREILGADALRTVHRTNL